MSLRYWYFLEQEQPSLNSWLILLINYNGSLVVRVLGLHMQWWDCLCIEIWVCVYLYHNYYYYQPQHLLLYHIWDQPCPALYCNYWIFCSFMASSELYVCCRKITFTHTTDTSYKQTDFNYYRSTVLSAYTCVWVIIVGLCEINWVGQGQRYTYACFFFYHT